MNQGQLAIDETSGHDVSTCEYLTEHREDLVTGGVAPPTAPDRLSRDPVCEVRNRSLRGLQHDALLTDPLERVHPPQIQPLPARLGRRRTLHPEGL